MDFCDRILHRSRVAFDMSTEELFADVLKFFRTHLLRRKVKDEAAETIEVTGLKN